jgi:hypothetical protein
MADHAPRRNPIGRPPLDRSDPICTKICVTFPSKKYDAVYHAARLARCSVPEFIRRAVYRRFPDTPDRPTR